MPKAPVSEPILPTIPSIAAFPSGVLPANVLAAPSAIFTPRLTSGLRAP